MKAEVKADGTPYCQQLDSRVSCRPIAVVRDVIERSLSLREMLSKIGRSHILWTKCVRVSVELKNLS